MLGTNLLHMFPSIYFRKHKYLSNYAPFQKWFSADKFLIYSSETKRVVFGQYVRSLDLSSTMSAICYINGVSPCYLLFCQRMEPSLNGETSWVNGRDEVQALNTCCSLCFQPCKQINKHIHCTILVNTYQRGNDKRSVPSLNAFPLPPISRHKLHPYMSRVWKQKINTVMTGRRQNDARERKGW